MPPWGRGAREPFYGHGNLLRARECMTEGTVAMRFFAMIKCYFSGLLLSVIPLLSACGETPDAGKSAPAKVENKGWTVAKYLLGHERMGSGSVGASRRELAALRALAHREQKNGKPLIEDLRFKDKISRIEIELDALEITSMRFLDQMRRKGQSPGADVSMLKIRGTEIQQMITELAMQAAGPQAQPFKAVLDGAIDPFTSRLAPRYFNFRKASIYAGSNEIQRNIIAKMSLGL